MISPPNLSDGLIFGPICKTITHRQATFAIWYPLQMSQLVLNDDTVFSPTPKPNFLRDVPQAMLAI